MKEEKESGKTPPEYYEVTRKSLISRMKSEDEDKINLKIKIATYVIWELSYSTPSWFKNYFLSEISKNMEKTDAAKNEKIRRTENDFYNNIGDYLINLESEVEYVKKILSPLTEEWDKKDFWRPIVADAFLMADIYFASSLVTVKDNCNQPDRTETKINPRYLLQTLIESPAALL